MRPTKVIIVDDQMLCREGLRELMAHWPEFEVIGEASSGEDAVDICEALSPDIVLMDVQMPGMDGVEATGIIAERHPDVKVIMLTVTADDNSLFGAIRNGAYGYILKDTPSKELRERLQGVSRGESPLSGLIATKMVNEVSSMTGRAEVVPEQPSFDYQAMFTPREIEILRLVAEGFSNVEVGSKLYLGAGTVKKHLSSIMQKLGLENRVQVATFAYKVGLMDAEDAPGSD